MDERGQRRVGAPGRARGDRRDAPTAVPARTASSRHSVDLPMPGAPRSTSAAGRSGAAERSAAAIRASSGCLPTTAGAGGRPATHSSYSARLSAEGGRPSRPSRFVRSRPYQRIAVCGAPAPQRRPHQLAVRVLVGGLGRDQPLPLAGEPQHGDVAGVQPVPRFLGPLGVGQVGQEVRRGTRRPAPSPPRGRRSAAPPGPGARTRRCRCRRRGRGTAPPARPPAAPPARSRAPAARSGPPCAGSPRPRRGTGAATAPR